MQWLVVVVVVAAAVAIFAAVAFVVAAAAAAVALPCFAHKCFQAFDQLKNSLKIISLFQDHTQY